MIHDKLPIHKTGSQLLGVAARILYYSMQGLVSRMLHAEKRVAELEAADAEPASPAAKAVEMDANKLHAAIMNLPMKPGWAGNDLALYAEGHRDARHAAAELVLAAMSAQGGKG